MSRNIITSTFSALFAPHTRAGELIDARLGSTLEGAEGTWLEAHLARCADCREVLRQRVLLRASLSAMGREAAPMGFAGRVLLAARTRPAVVEESGSEGAPSRWRGYEMAAGVAAAGLVVVAMVAVYPRAKDTTTPETLSGGSTLSLQEAEHFVVRAPGLGAAKARVLATEVVAAHGGTYTERGGAIVARIPRAALLPVTQDLARRSAFRMSKSEGVELPASAQSIVIRFELE